MKVSSTGYDLERDASQKMLGVGYIYIDIYKYINENRKMKTKGQVFARLLITNVQQPPPSQSPLHNPVSRRTVYRSCRILRVMSEILSLF